MDVLEVARFSTLPEAELAAALLRDHGIDAYLPDRQMANSMPHLHIAIGNIRIVAPVGQIVEARAIMARARAGQFISADENDDGEWSLDAAPGKVGELDDDEIYGVMKPIKTIGIAVIVAMVIGSFVVALLPFDA